MTATIGDCPVVTVRQLAKSFAPSTDGPPVLSDVNFEIRAGDKVSLVGPSGSGKSTLLLLLAGLLRPDRGSVEIDGTPISELDDAQRAHVRAERIGIALQADNLIPFLSAGENVELALGFARRSGRPGHRRGAAADDRAITLLERFGVADQAGHLPRHLSGGEAQRVALAVAMANEPALLLADEVVAALDRRTAGAVVDQVLEAGFAVLYVTHDVALADRVDRRLAIVGRTVVER